MMITGYDPGTAVKWNDDEAGTLRTGYVLRRFHEPGSFTINGEEMDIEVIGDSPTYVVEDERDHNTIVLDHREVFTEHMNAHT